MKVPISQYVQEKRIPNKSSTPSESNATSVYVNDAERVRDERLLSKLVEQTEKGRSFSANMRNDALQLERLQSRNAVVQQAAMDFTTATGAEKNTANEMNFAARQNGANNHNELLLVLIKQVQGLIQSQIEFQRHLIANREEIRRMQETMAHQSEVKEAERARMQPEIDEIGFVSMDTSPPPPVSNEENSSDGRNDGFPIGTLPRIPKQAEGSKVAIAEKKQHVNKVRAKNSSRHQVRQNSTLHSCEECGKEFNRKDHLTRHLRIHTGAKPFKCQICKAAFNEKYSLSRHSLTHTDEKPFMCDICQGRFRRKTHLCLHMLIHSGLKPWKCNVCQKDFRKKSTLTKHQKLHFNDKE